MINLISGKEAKLAWANGEELEFYSPDLDVWFGLNDEPFMSDVFDTRLIRLKQRTVNLNGLVKNIGLLLTTLHTDIAILRKVLE